MLWIKPIHTASTRQSVRRSSGTVMTWRETANKKRSSMLLEEETRDKAEAIWVMTHEVGLLVLRIIMSVKHWKDQLWDEMLGKQCSQTTNYLLPIQQELRRKKFARKLVSPSKQLSQVTDLITRHIYTWNRSLLHESIKDKNMKHKNEFNDCTYIQLDQEANMAEVINDVIVTRKWKSIFGGGRGGESKWVW